MSNELVMSSGVLKLLIRSLGGLGCLLMIGCFLRAKVPVFRKMLIPASVIGGFIGLFLGPEVLGLSGFSIVPEDFVATWKYLPGIMIVPIFASIPLGMFKDKTKKKTKDKKENIRNTSRIAILSGVGLAQMSTQIVFAITIALILGKIFPSWDLYPCFGYEMSQGFNGGHGTAGAVGNILLEHGVERWELVQGVTTTFATVGLLGGIILGIIFINKASKEGKTAFLKSAAELPDSINKGIVTDVEEQGSVGRETTSSSNIETLTVHLGLIFIAVMLAYYILGVSKEYNIPGLKDIPVWPYALIVMYGINFLLDKFNLQWLIDKSVKSHLSGVFADFAICGAIASMPLRAIMGYMFPIVIIAGLGFGFVYLMTIKMYEKLLPDSFPFERGIFQFGMGTGVMMTGLALLKICDPEFKSTVLEDKSVVSVVTVPYDLITVPIMYNILAEGTSMQMLIFGLVYSAIVLTVALIGSHFYKKTIVPGHDDTE